MIGIDIGPVELFLVYFQLGCGLVDRVFCVDQVNLSPDLLVPEIFAALIQVFIIVELGLVAGDCLALDGIVELDEQLAFADVIPHFDIYSAYHAAIALGGDRWSSSRLSTLPWRSIKWVKEVSFEGLSGLTSLALRLVAEAGPAYRSPPEGRKFLFAELVLLVFRRVRRAFFLGPREPSF
jgi:hypothetical protein